MPRPHLTAPRLFLLHLAVLIILAPFALANNATGMFNGLDGDYMRILVRHQHDWMAAGHFSLNPFQGMGNAFFPFDMNLVPAFFLQVAWTGGEVSPTVAYTVFAAELFGATYLIARTLGFLPGVGILGGWLVTLLALPLAPSPRLYAVYGLVPNCLDLIACLALLVWGVKAVADRRRWMSWVGAAALVLVPVFAAVQNPLVVMIIVPAGAAWMAAILLADPAAAHRRRRLLGIAAAAATFGSSGALLFLLGNTLYTVPAFFSDELLQGQAILHNASIVFQGGPEWKNRSGLWLVALSILGALLVLRRPGDVGRTAGAVHVGLTACVVAGGWLLVKYASGWRGPQMIYFELAIWPFYAIFAAFLLIRVSSSVAAAGARLAGSNSHGRIVAYGGVLVAALALVRGAVIPAPQPSRPFPPLLTPIVADLRDETSLAVGRDFRGMAATFTGAVGKEGISWFDQAPFDGRLERATGNDHRFVGLWHYGIPTLQEYNHYTTPPSYLVFSRLLARPADRQIRSITVLTTPNIGLLEVFGVRYVVSDQPLPPPAKLRRTQPATGEGVALHLYELPNPNLGTLAPAVAIRAGSASEQLDAMAVNDLHHAVVAATALPERLAPVRDARMRFDTRGVHVSAYSEGEAVLVLPLQFSRCLAARGSGAEGAALFRANLIQTGIRFSGTLDLALEFRNGVLGDAGCRYADYEDMKTLDLRGAARARPLESVPTL